MCDDVQMYERFKFSHKHLMLDIFGVELKYLPRKETLPSLFQDRQTDRQTDRGGGGGGGNLFSLQLPILSLECLRYFPGNFEHESWQC